MLEVERDGVGIGKYVKYNEDLDFWDGSNYTSGQIGEHLGITKLKSTGEFVLIFGTQWQGGRDRAVVVSDEKALREIIRTGSDEMLKSKKFSRLKDMMEENLDEE